MQFKLPRTLFEFLGVVIRDAPLPMLGGAVGLQLNLPVKVGNTRRNATMAKVIFAAGMQHPAASALTRGSIALPSFASSSGSSCAIA